MITNRNFAFIQFSGKNKKKIKEITRMKNAVKIT